MTIEMLEQLLDAFNAHDIEAVMSFFADDCVLEMLRGPDPWGRRLEGREHVARVSPAASPASPTCTTATRAPLGRRRSGDAPSGC